MNFRVGNLFREVSYSTRRNPSLFLGTLLTILISLAFLAGGLVVRYAVNNATARWQDGIEFILFMSPEATAAETNAISAKLDQNPEIDTFTFVNKEEAYDEFQLIFRDSEQIRDSVTVEDLPPSFRVAPENPDAAVVEALADGFRDDPGVLEVVAAVDTIRGIERITSRINFGLAVIGLVLLFAAVLLVYNMIRTTIFARRREVEVMRLVGASNWYIRLPFMTEGILQGLLGGALTYPLLSWMNNRLGDLGSGDGLGLLSNFFANDSQILLVWVAMVILGVIIGAAASAVALSRFLDV